MSEQATIQTEFADDVQAIVEAHLAAEAAGVKNDDAMARIAQWVASGVYPNNATIIYGYVTAGKKKSSAKTYASAILKWVKAGKMPKNIQQAVNTNPPGHVKDPKKGGRPAGQGAGKTTAPTEGAAPAKAAAELPADDRQWKMVLEGMIARIPGRKDWSMDDINAYRDCASKMIALLQRNSK